VTIQDDDRPDDGAAHRAVPERTSHRRRIQVAAVAGLAILGAGAYAITTQAGDGGRTAARNTGAVGSASADAQLQGQADSVTSSSGPSPAPGNRVAPAPSLSQKVDDQIRKAREKAAKDGYPLQRAITPTPGAAAGPVQTRSLPRKNGSLRVTTARFDLTGQQELLWVADKGKPVGGGISCSQKFKFSNNSEATVRPTMLVCWLTSKSKSVVTVLVDLGGKPTAAESAQVITTEWAKLGG
jgi:hypothetical protein